MGQELEGMAGQLSKWAGAVADIGKAEQVQKNRSIFRKTTDSQSIAMELYTAKLAARKQREELKQLISYTQGINGWHEFLDIEKQVIKEKQQAEWAELERKEKIKEYMVNALVVILVLTATVGIVWLGLAINEVYRSGK